MKNIAVLVHSITIEYAVEVLNGITAFFNQKDDVRLIVSQVKNPHCIIGLYEYQCWSAVDYLFSKEIDGVIVISGSFSSTMETENLAEALKKYEGKVPILSIGSDLKLKKSYYTKTECSKAYSDVIKHLATEHNCSRIAFMGARATHSTEAYDRFEAYKQALQENNLTYSDKLVYDAFFTTNTAYEVMKNVIASNEQLPFDSILAANDLMALGCLKALQESGRKVPEDIKIAGFDNTTHASKSIPKLTTIDQQIFNQGFEGARFMYELLNGTTKDNFRTLYPEVVYRTSCGCNILNEQADADKKIIPAANGQYFNFLTEIDNIYTLFDMVKASNSIKKFFYSLTYLLQTSQILSMAVCLYDKPITVLREDDFTVPDTVNLSMFVDTINNIEVFEPGIKFDPHKKILPEKYFDNISGNYYFQPIFSGESNYGYLICTLKNSTYSVYCILLKVLINALIQSYELSNSFTENEELSKLNQQLQLDNSDLSLQSKTDELTKILNRRGFLELGQKTLEIALDMGSSGLVFFTDMDGLKFINDTYGHKMGDKAIKAMATVLTKTLRANDVVGRLSGDEFAAVAVGLKLSQIQKIRNKIDKLCKEISIEKEFPFTLSCSFGAVEFNKKKKKLQPLLREADKELYVEKNRKHALLNKK